MRLTSGGTFPFQAMKTKNGEYFLTWFEMGFGDSITQLVNLETKTLLGSGIIIKDHKTIVHFDQAKIEKVVSSKGK